MAKTDPAEDINELVLIIGRYVTINLSMKNKL